MKGNYDFVSRKDGSISPFRTHLISAGENPLEAWEILCAELLEAQQQLAALTAERDKLLSDCRVMAQVVLLEHKPKYATYEDDHCTCDACGVARRYV